MINSRSNALMITEEDIEQLFSQWDNVPAWVKAHVSAKCPAHRYEGELLLDSESLVFSGRDIKEGNCFELKIPFGVINNVTIGFSEDLKASLDLAFGIGGPVPFAVSHQDNGRSGTVCFNTTSDNYLPHQHINNIRWYEMLSAIVAGNRGLKPISPEKSLPGDGIMNLREASIEIGGLACGCSSI